MYFRVCKCLIFANVSSNRNSLNLRMRWKLRRRTCRCRWSFWSCRGNSWSSRQRTILTRVSGQTSLLQTSYTVPAAHLAALNVPGRAEIRVDAIRSKLIPTPSLDLKSRPGEKTKQQPLKKIVWDKQEQAWIELSKTLKAGVETSAIGLVLLPGNLSSF